MRYSAIAVVAAGFAAATQSNCPAPGETSADGRYSCNPAHTYPSGQVCQETEGCYYLVFQPDGVTASASVSVDVPVYRTSSAPVTQGTKGACPAAGESSADGRYSCNPAHTYPSGQVCQETEGCYYLVYQPDGVTASPSVSVDVPVYRTETVMSYTTYCPSPTTFVHSVPSHPPSTYIVTKPTTITVPCPGGCVVTHPVTSVPGLPATTPPPVYHPATTPTAMYHPVASSTLVPSLPGSKNATASHTMAVYTGGAAAFATGAPLAAAAGIAAFFF